MKLLITSQIPNPILTPDEIRLAVLQMVEVNLSLPDFVTQVLIQNHDFCETTARIYARQFGIPVSLMSLTPLNVQPDAVLEFKHPSEMTNTGATEGVCKKFNVPYYAAAISEELPQTGIIATTENGEKILLTDDLA